MISKALYHDPGGPHNNPVKHYHYHYNPCFIVSIGAQRGYQSHIVKLEGEQKPAPSLLYSFILNSSLESSGQCHVRSLGRAVPCWGSREGSAKLGVQGGQSQRGKPQGRQAKDKPRLTRPGEGSRNWNQISHSQGTVLLSSPEHQGAKETQRGWETSQRERLGWETQSYRSLRASNRKQLWRRGQVEIQLSLNLLHADWGFCSTFSISRVEPSSWPST